MKLKPFICVVSPIKMTLTGGAVTIERDEVVYIMTGTDEKDVTEAALRRYKSYPRKFKYDEIMVHALDFRPEMIRKFVEGEILELAKQKLEIFDELDSDVIL